MKESSQRLKDALAHKDLALTLCLLMAQRKNCIAHYEKADEILELFEKLYGQCQDALIQFGTFLGSSYSVDEYMKRSSSIHDMLHVCHIQTDVAFFLAGPILAHQISVHLNTSNFHCFLSITISYDIYIIYLIPAKIRSTPERRR